MLSKIVAGLLICVVFTAAGTNAAFAAGSHEKNLAKSERKLKKHAAKIKAAVNKLGVGKDSLVKIKLRDKTKVKGYISEIVDENFTVVDTKGEAHVIAYSNAKQIRGNNLHTGAWVAIGIGIGVIVFWIIFRQFDS